MEDIIGEVFFTCIGLFFLLVGLWGVIDFKNFKIFYFKFMDNRNSLNINYPKGEYSNGVLWIFVVMSLATGLLLVGSVVLTYLNILPFHL